MYMNAKKEFKNRLLNIMYSRYAMQLQFGTFLAMLLLLENREIIIFNTYVWNFILEVRALNLLLILAYNLLIAILHNIYNFNGDLYMDCSEKQKPFPLFIIICCLCILKNSASYLICKVCKKYERYVTKFYILQEFLPSTETGNTCVHHERVIVIKIMGLAALFCYLIVFSEYIFQFIVTKSYLECCRRTTPVEPFEISVYSVSDDFQFGKPEDNPELQTVIIPSIPEHVR